MLSFSKTLTFLCLVGGIAASPLMERREPVFGDLAVRGNNSSSSSNSTESSNNNSNNNSNNSTNNENNNNQNSQQNQNQNNNNNGQSVSLNNWNNIQSMQNFDNFRGSNNFNGGSNGQVTIIQTPELVCRTQQIEVVQQRLVVLQQMAQRIITEQVCEVETQTIILQQFNSGLTVFQNDIGRQNGRQPGFDAQVAGQLGQLTNSDGSLTSNDLGINGKTVGNQVSVPSGSNWNDNSGPQSVSNAKQAAEQAQQASQANQSNNNQQNNQTQSQN